MESLLQEAAPRAPTFKRQRRLFEVQSNPITHLGKIKVASLCAENEILFLESSKLTCSAAVWPVFLSSCSSATLALAH